MQSGTKAIRRC